MMQVTGHVALIGRNLTDEEYRTRSLTSVRFQGWGDPATDARTKKFLVKRVFKKKG